MKRSLTFIICGLALVCLYLFGVYSSSDGAADAKSTVFIEEALPTGVPLETPAADVSAAVPEVTIVPTTISGGMAIKNTTDYDIDINAIADGGCALRLPKDTPQVLIIHTHSSEAYSPAGLDKYEDLGTNRTLDKNCSVIRVGDELARILTEHGLSVIHDTQVFDYPSYTGSYNRSCEVIQRYLDENPGIRVVIDLHRDALGSDTVTYKTAAEESGVCASQVMLVVGSDASGLEHPGWRQNLSFAVYLQNAVCQRHASLMRPVLLAKYRYNQQLTPGSIIVEVGSNGNTLQEALAAVRLFGNAAGEALSALIEQ